MEAFYPARGRLVSVPEVPGRRDLEAAAALGYVVPMARTILPALAAAAAIALSSCSPGMNTAVLLTDRAEFAFYADAFNASQGRYHVELRYRPNVSRILEEGTETGASLVVGRYLANSSARSRFVNLDYLFRELILNPSGIYQSLLAGGELDGRQLLLPVSFNMPLVAFRRSESRLTKDNFVISLEEMRAAAAEANEAKEGGFVRMGFSPRWDAGFLFLYARLHGAAFREGTPLAWSDEGLAAALAGTKAWSVEVNRSPVDEEDFQFKYLYVPHHLAVLSGRIRFAFMDSSEYFLLSEERRAPLDYRWVAQGNSIPVLEDVLYAGILRKGSGRGAAESFLKWFFREETQRFLLERSKQMRTNESVFGIAGGFSSVRSVNERALAAFYPSLLGHLPPPEYLTASPSLPGEWVELKSRILDPFLQNAAGAAPRDFDPSADLRRRIDQWKKQAAGS